MSKRRMFSVLRYRGDHIVPNFEEIWPSGKPRRQRRGAPSAPTKGIAYIEHAMATGILGEKDKDFTTVGKPKVNNPENYTPSNVMIIAMCTVRTANVSLL